MRVVLAIAYVTFIAAFLVVSLRSSASRDDGRYAQSPHKKWFESLQNKNGANCCDGSDGKRLEDAEWGTDTEGYWVIIDRQRITVPDESVIIGRNRVGVAVVWPYIENGQTKVRCFIPTSLS